MGRQYYCYIMTNVSGSVIYTGVTENLIRRVHEHREMVHRGFTKKYKVTKLVYYEVFADPQNAIDREKQIKGGSRQKKIDLINGDNPTWQDLYDGL
jgi:putative endonuclease